jgi:hypothetical protein
MAALQELEAARAKLLTSLGDKAPNASPCIEPNQPSPPL